MHKLKVSLAFNSIFVRVIKNAFLTNFFKAGKAFD